MGEISGWSIHCVEGPLAPSEYEITEAGLTMGRGDFNGIVLNSGNVSRKHVRVFLFDGVPYVQDMDSRNGVFVNGERISQQVPLSMADSVTVGEFRFALKGPGGAAAGAPGGASSKRPLIIGAAVVAVLALGGIAIGLSGGGDDSKPPAAVDNSAKTQNLFDFKAPAAVPGAASAPAQGEPQRNIDVASASLATQGGDGAQISAEQRAKLVKEYLERGLMNQDQGRLKEAKTFYDRAVQLDPGCALCVSRLERADREIQETTQKHFDAALRYYNGMRYEEAVANWELVLNLQDDHNSEMYNKSMEYIEEARRKLEASRQY